MPLMACGGSPPNVIEAPRAQIPADLFAQRPAPAVPPKGAPANAVAHYLTDLFFWGAEGWDKLARVQGALGQ